MFTLKIYNLYSLKQTEIMYFMNSFLLYVEKFKEISNYAGLRSD